MAGEILWLWREHPALWGFILFPCGFSALTRHPWVPHWWHWGAQESWERGQQHPDLLFPLGKRYMTGTAQSSCFQPLKHTQHCSPEITWTAFPWHSSDEDILTAAVWHHASQLMSAFLQTQPTFSAPSLPTYLKNWLIIRNGDPLRE